MPGVLLVEAMAQTAGAVVLEHLGDAHAGKLVFFMSIENAKFRKPVVPGDQRRTSADTTRLRTELRWQPRKLALDYGPPP